MERETHFYCLVQNVSLSSDCLKQLRAEPAMGLNHNDFYVYDLKASSFNAANFDETHSKKIE